MLEYLTVDRTFLQSPRLIRCARSTGTSRLIFAAHVLALWSAVAELRERGDLEGIDDVVLEAWAEWHGKPGMFAEAFRANFMDGTVIHGWQDRYARVFRHRERNNPQHARNMRSTCAQPGGIVMASCAKSDGICAQPARNLLATCTQPASNLRATCEQPARNLRATCAQSARNLRATCARKSKSKSKSILERVSNIDAGGQPVDNLPARGGNCTAFTFFSRIYDDGEKRGQVYAARYSQALRESLGPELAPYAEAVAEVIAKRALASTSPRAYIGGCVKRPWVRALAAKIEAERARAVHAGEERQAPGPLPRANGPPPGPETVGAILAAAGMVPPKPAKEKKEAR